MQVEVWLLCVSPSKGQTFVLVGDGLPAMKLVGTSLETAALLLKACLGLDGRVAGRGFVDLEQLPVLDEVWREENGERVVVIPYRCILPEEHLRKPLQGEWKNVFDLFDLPMGQFLLSALRKF